MASRTYFDKYKAYWLAGDSVPASMTAPTTTEITAGDRLLRLLAEGGVTFTANEGNVSQDLLDEGKTSEDVGIRSVTGLQITWELDFAADGSLAGNDTNWDLFSYGTKGSLIVVLDGESAVGKACHVFKGTAHDPSTMAPSANAKQNARVSIAVEDWEFKAVIA